MLVNGSVSGSRNSEIWVVNLDAAAPLLRQVSNPAVALERVEPEWLVLPDAVYVYHSQFEGSGRRASLHRSAAGS
jgi:hypothetical protein